MKYSKRQLKIYTTTYEATLDNGRSIVIYSYDGVVEKVCEWVVWPGDGSSPITNGICYGVKEAKAQAEAAAEG